jgi:putative membrane protein
MAEILAGSVKLKDGTSELDTKVVKKLTTFYEDNIRDLDRRITDLTEAAEGYTTFTGASDNEDSRVRFIYKTDGIEA